MFRQFIENHVFSYLASPKAKGWKDSGPSRTISDRRLVAEGRSQQTLLAHKEKGPARDLFSGLQRASACKWRMSRDWCRIFSTLQNYQGVRRPLATP